MNIVSLLTKFEFYKSIDELPIYHWMKIQETNDLTWILKKKRECSKGQFQVLESYLQKMTDEYIDTFGISDQYRNILKLQGELRCKEIDYLISDNKMHLTFIEIKKAELKNAISQSEKSDLMSIQVHVRKYMGQPINMKETSVKEFYGILSEIQKESKQNAE
jgi:hypothetical protein